MLSDLSSLKGHYLSVHQLDYDLRTRFLRDFMDEELRLSMRRLRRQQYSGRDLAAFEPSDVPGRKRRKTTRTEHLSDDESTSGRSGSALCVTSPVLLMPASIYEVPDNLSAAQCSSSRLPDSLSIHSEELDISVFDWTLSLPVSASVSVTSFLQSAPPSRQSSPVSSARFVKVEPEENFETGNASETGNF